MRYWGRFSIAIVFVRTVQGRRAVVCSLAVWPHFQLIHAQPLLLMQSKDAEQEEAARRVNWRLDLKDHRETRQSDAIGIHQLGYTYQVSDMVPTRSKARPAYGLFWSVQHPRQFCRIRQF